MFAPKWALQKWNKVYLYMVYLQTSAREDIITIANCTVHEWQFLHHDDSRNKQIKALATAKGDMFVYACTQYDG